MNYVDRAEEISKTGLNCAQAVAGAFAGLYKGVSKEDVLNMTSPLGGGFGRKRELCGAVNGMGIAYGLILGTHTADEKMKTYETAALLADRFIGRYSSIVCREIVDLKPDPGLTPRDKQLTEQEKTDGHWPCSDYIRGAVQILEGYLIEQGIIDG